MAISQETALKLFNAANEALSLFDNYPQLFEMVGTLEVLTDAVENAYRDMQESGDCEYLG